MPWPSVCTISILPSVVSVQPPKTGTTSSVNSLVDSPPSDPPLWLLGISLPGTTNTPPWKENPMRLLLEGSLFASIGGSIFVSGVAVVTFVEIGLNSARGPTKCVTKIMERRALVRVCPSGCFGVNFVAHFVEHFVEIGHFSIKCATKCATKSLERGLGTSSS